MSQYFIGLSLYDPIAKETLLSHNDDRYFTPASNTKIVTLAAYLNLNLRNIPSFRSRSENGNLTLLPLGDPSFLHPDFIDDQPAYESIRKLRPDTIIVAPPVTPISAYGPGWAWDDYSYYFQPERSWFPIYANVIDIKIEGDDYWVTPGFFENFIDFNAEKRSRDRKHNLFNFPLAEYLGDSTDFDLPFTINQELIETLLTDTLHTTIEIGSPAPLQDWGLIFGSNAKSVLATMMLRSDNFLAEQLLVNAQRYEGYESQVSYMNHLKNSLFQDLPDPLIWEDGSGLSRYNMNTPRNQVKILEKIYEMVDWEDIKAIFPTGGVSGTIRKWYSADEPYIYAKTGTLRHNHCLSGYIVTDSGRKLIFSFMNNHYTTTTSEVKKQMQEVLETIKKSY